MLFSSLQSIGITVSLLFAAIGRSKLLEPNMTQPFPGAFLDCFHMFSHIFTNMSYVWVNYNDLTATSLEIIVNKGNHPQMALIQVSEIL